MTRPTRETPATVGAVVMALGIFQAASLRHVPGGVALEKPVAALVVLVWLAAAVKLLASIRRRGISAYVEPSIGMFGIGTWIAGTAIVAQVAMPTWPGVPWISKSFFFVSLALWVWFFPVAIRKLLLLATDRNLRPRGIVLLTTVATQAVAVVALRLFAGLPAVRAASTLLIAIGAGCYLAGLYLIVRRHLDIREWSLVSDWHNTNCILHGALSITGLAVVISGLFAADSILVFWICVLAVFGIVEAIEAIRLWARVRNLGLRRAIWVYDISQWARNFTFGMLYAFTQEFAERFDIGHGHPQLNVLRGFVLAYGQYVVLLLLIAELSLAATASLDRWTMTYSAAVRTRGR